MNDPLQIRRATTADVPAVARIINDAAEYGLMLHRSMAYLYEKVRDFHVAVDGDQIVGVCGLSIVWGNLAEIYALAVAPSQRGRGVGGKLVQACIDEAPLIGIRKLMALTYEQRFFEKLGFTVVDRQNLPLKVWSQCVNCSKNQACDEIAMILVNESVPDIEIEQPSAQQYVVPVVSTIRPASGSRQKMDEAP